MDYDKMLTAHKQRKADATIAVLNVSLKEALESISKGEIFSRPVLIVRQLTSDLFIGIPITTTIKDNGESSGGQRAQGHSSNGMGHTEYSYSVQAAPIMTSQANSPT